MPRKRRIGYRITIAQVGLTRDPEFVAAPAEVKREVLGWLLVFGLRAKDRELAAGLDRYGRPLAPISQATRANRKSEMGPADPDAPPLMPAYAVSRTRLLLTGEIRGDGVDYFWEYDPHTGESWGETLLHHRRGVGRRKVVRDVIGISPGSQADVNADVWARWLAWKRQRIRRPYRRPAPAPTPPPPRLVATGRTDYQNFTFGIGASGAPAPGVQATGFRQRRPGQGWTAFGGPNGPGARPGPPGPPPQPRPALPTPPTPPGGLDSLRDAVKGAGGILKRQEAVRAWVAGRMSAAAAPVRAHGMARPEDLHSLEIDGVTFHFPAFVPGQPHPMVGTLRRLAEGPAIPGPLWRAVKEVVFAAQADADEARYREATGLDAPVHASGAGGRVTVYRGQPISPGYLAHEAAHSFAEGRYGNATPRPLSDFAAARESGEPPPTDYARVSLAEDFAESARLYYEDPGTLARVAPRRFAVIDRLMRDPAYRG